MAELVVFAGLPQALARLCLRDGRQRKEIAEAAGINASMLSGFLNGRRTPSLEHLDRLLTEMEFTVEDLNYELRAVGYRPTKSQSMQKPERETAAAILATLLESVQTLIKEQEKGAPPPPASPKARRKKKGE